MVSMNNSFPISSVALLIFLILIIFLFKDKLAKKVECFLLAVLAGTTVSFFIVLLFQSLNIDLSTNYGSYIASVAVVTNYLILCRFVYILSNRKKTLLSLKNLITMFMPSFAWLYLIFSYPGIIGKYHLESGNEEILSSVVFKGMGTIPFIAYALAGISLVINFYYITKTFELRFLKSRKLELDNKTKLDNEYRNLIVKDLKNAEQIKADISSEIDKLRSKILNDDPITFEDENLKKRIDELCGIQFCSNRTINSILVSKYSTAKANDINIHMPIEIGNIDSYDELDICKVIFNILDNALAAAIKVPESSQRTIYFAITANHNTFNLYCENTYNKSLKSIPSAEHGYGHRILNDIATKYNGVFKHESSNGKYITTFII